MCYGGCQYTGCCCRCCCCRALTLRRPHQGHRTPPAALPGGGKPGELRCERGRAVGVCGGVCCAHPTRGACVSGACVRGGRGMAAAARVRTCACGRRTRERRSSACAQPHKRTCAATACALATQGAPASCRAWRRWRRRSGCVACRRSRAASWLASSGAAAALAAQALACCACAVGWTAPRGGRRASVAPARLALAPAPCSGAPRGSSRAHHTTGAKRQRHRGHSFFTTNEELLAAYAACETAADVIAAQNAWLEQATAGACAPCGVCAHARVHARAGTSVHTLRMHALDAT
jgi:hypothetical protein